MSNEIAIIGAGLAGLSLALILSDMGVSVTVYEHRPAPLNIGGAVMLSPNALRVFDKVGLYQDIKSKGYNFDDLEWRTTSNKFLDSYEFGGVQKYGYQASRIYRYELIDIALAKIRSRGIKVEYGHKFSHVVEETDDHVTWQFTDNTTASASILIGADGIHSTVRNYLHPDVEPEFTGMIAITANVAASQLPASINKIDKPLTILSKDKGGFIIAPQKVDGSEFLIGKQKRMPDQTREGWARLSADKEASVRFLQSDNEVFGEIATATTQEIPRETINFWPLYLIPQLERWASEEHMRVMLVGDAAHAIPPSAGQGISQAIEDVYMLSLLLAKADEKSRAFSMHEALAFWQSYRKDRVQKVLALNHLVDMRRTPKEQGQGQVEEGGSGIGGGGIIGPMSTGTERQQPEEEMVKVDWDLAWLYGVDLDNVVDEWVKKQEALV